MELGKLLNCSTANTFTIAACLKVTAADEIVAKQEKLLVSNLLLRLGPGCRNHCHNFDVNFITGRDRNGR